VGAFSLSSCRGKIGEERDNLSLREIATVATLEIVAVHASDGWLLSVVVEDEVGPRVSDEDGDTDQKIDHGTFHNEFIRRGRGSANVVAEVENPAAKARLTSLLGAIETNRHRSDVVCRDASTADRRRVATSD